MKKKKGFEIIVDFHSILRFFFVQIIMSVIPLRPVRASSLLLLGYLSVSITVPFMWSYKETSRYDMGVKGTINARALFNKI